MKIEVTREDIVLGVPIMPSCCPVANAIHRLPGISSCRVYEENIIVFIGGTKIERNTPEKVQSFIRYFDDESRKDEDLPEPFSFELDI